MEATMSAADILIDLEALPPNDPINVWGFRDKIRDGLDQAQTESEREALFQIWCGLIQLAKEQGESIEGLEFFEGDYHSWMLKEAQTSPGIVEPFRMAAVVRREVAAGRLSEDSVAYKRAIAREKQKLFEMDEKPDQSHNFPTGMFGMKDYRAHKLRKVLMWPLRIFSLFLIWSLLAGSIIFTLSLKGNVVMSIIIAYAIFTVAGILLFLVLWPLGILLDKIFFFIIDVVPAHGANQEEAMGIVKLGRIYELDRKVATQIERWTRADTRELVSLHNWRARWFFPTAKRWERIIAELKVLQRTGQKVPTNDVKEVIDDIIKRLHLEPSWLEQAIVGMWFYSIIYVGIIVWAIANWARP
jgi:hypothetical protein